MHRETHDPDEALEISPGSGIEHGTDAEDRGVATIWWKLTSKADYIDYLERLICSTRNVRAEVEAIPNDALIGFKVSAAGKLFDPGLWRREKPYLNRCRLEILAICSLTGMSVTNSFGIWYEHSAIWREQWNANQKLVRWPWLDDETLFRQNKFKTLIESLLR